MSTKDKFLAEAQKVGIRSPFVGKPESVKILKGEKGDPSDPKKVANILKNDPVFARKVRGKKGDPAKAKDVARILKNDPVFKKSVKGKQGDSVDADEVIEELEKKIPTLEAIAEKVVEMIEVPQAEDVAKHVKVKTKRAIFGSAEKITKEQIIEMLKNEFDFNDLKNIPEIFTGRAGARGAGNVIDLADVDVPKGGITPLHVLRRKADGSGFEFAAGAAVGSNFADNETPGGSGTSWTLANAPSPASSLQFFANGQLLTGGGVDYTLSGVNVTTVSNLGSSVVRASYRY